jgi:1-phosphofructokinase
MKAHPTVVTVTLNPALDQTVTIPRFTAGEVNRVAAVTQVPGGKGVNVASALADHGYCVAVTGFLGQDNAGEFEELFARKEIADHFIRLPGPTRVGIKISDPELGQTTDINYPGLAPAEFDLRKLHREITDLAGLDHPWFVLGGSVPPGVSPGIYAELVRQIRALGKQVVLDTSGEPLRLALEAGPAIIKPNVHELEELLGRRLSSSGQVLEAARELRGRGIGLVVVSMGAEGALFVAEQGAVLARPPRIKILSTVGAGDAMVAGTVAAQLRGLDLAETARLATAFSVVALQRLDASACVGGVEATLPHVSVEEFRL